MQQVEPDAARIDTELAIRIHDVGSITHQPANFDKFAIPIDRRCLASPCRRLCSPSPTRCVNPTDATNTASTLRDVETAARAIGLQLQVLNASTSREINAAFEDVGRDRPDALVVGGNPFLTARRPRRRAG